jgi:hypothetical protein
LLLLGIVPSEMATSTATSSAKRSNKGAKYTLVDDELSDEFDLDYDMSGDEDIDFGNSKLISNISLEDELDEDDAEEIQLFAASIREQTRAMQFDQSDTGTISDS